MFLNFNPILKVGVLVCLCSIIFYAGYELFFFALKLDNLFLELSIALTQCFLFILIGFFLFQTTKKVRFPERFYKLRFYESETFFRIIGVYVYQYILVNSFLRHANPRVYIKGRGRSYIKVFYEETKQSETSHVIALVFTWLVQIAYLSHGKFVLFFSLTFFTIAFNFYPIQLQRKNRFMVAARFNDLTNI